MGTLTERAIEEALNKIYRLLLAGDKHEAQIAFRALMMLLDDGE